MPLTPNLIMTIRNLKKFSENAQKLYEELSIKYSEDIKTEFPDKPQEDNLEEELTYTKELMAVVKKH